MADVLELVSFGLPPTFPPEAMPDAGAQFVKACWAGMTKGQLVTRAQARLAPELGTAGAHGRGRGC